MTLEMKPVPGLRNHVTEFYREQFIEQSGFDPSTPSTTLGTGAIPRQRHSRAGGTGKLTTSGLTAGEHQVAVGMPLIRPTPADMKKGMEILAEHGVMPARKPVVIHPGSGGRHKCWHLRNFLSVARMLANEGAEVVFLLGPAERERFGESETAEIKRTGTALVNLTLADVLAVLGCARGFIGNDSGITHLAAALGIRTVAVFGPTPDDDIRGQANPVVYGPIGPAVTVLRSREQDFAGAISEDLQQQICEILLA
jgi:ADP-heptose:LPS heptosyltransferase